MTDNWCRGGKIVQWITIEIPGCVSIRPVMFVRKRFHIFHYLLGGVQLHHNS